MFIGRKVDVGIGKETVRGTGVPATFTLPKTKIDFEAKANKAVSGEGLGNISAMGNQAVVTGLFSEGSIEGELNANSFGLILLATLGSSSPAAYGTGYKHTFTVLNSNQHTSLSLHFQDEIGDIQFKMCMVDSLEISINNEDIVQFTLGLKGRKVHDGTYTPSYAADYKFMGRDVIFKVAAATANLAAATAISVKDLKITINKNTEFNWVLGTLEPEDINNRNLKIEGSITLNYEDRTWRNYMLNGDTKALGIKLTNPRDAVGGGTNYAEFYIEFPKVHFSEWESQRDNDDIVTQKINFTALYDIATSKLISDCYITNTTASY